MWPIAICSVVALAIFLDRLYVLWRFSQGTRALVQEVEHLIAKRGLSEAVTVCQRVGSPLARIFLAALRSAGRPREQIKALVEEAGIREAAPLERYLGLLGTLANIAPLMGLLGTVIGMIKAFNVISTQGVGTPATLGGGISEALITTAAGLTIAIPILLLHRYLVGKVDRTIHEMEGYSLRMVELLEGV